MYHVLTDVFNLNTDFFWHEKNLPDNLDAVILPGGFSYGDRLRAGVIAAHSPIISDVKKLAEQGIPILGVCNGFQILVESGLLPGVLLRNKYLEFICKNVFVKANNKDNSYFKDDKKDVYEFHIAHNEGNYFCSNEQIKEINDNNQIALFYSDENGNVNEQSNPNGSLQNIAGVFNKQKNVLGMMPHPERMIDPALSGEDGSIFFENLINNLK